MVHFQKNLETKSGQLDAILPSCGELLLVIDVL